mgnify:CR=1 FL=1
MSRKPETKLAIARKITRKDVENDKSLSDNSIGRWAVVGSGCLILCDSYREATELASSFNRCPA